MCPDADAKYLFTDQSFGSRGPTDGRIKRIGKRNRDATLKKEKKKERKKNMDDKICREER